MSVGRNNNKNNFGGRNFLTLLKLTGFAFILTACATKQGVETEQTAPAVIDVPSEIIVVEENEIVVEEFVVEPVAEVAAPEEAAVSSMPTKATGDVKWIQQRLKDLGYYTGPIDGSAGGATRRAIKDYQLDQSVEQDGDATKVLQDFMWRNGG